MLKLIEKILSFLPKPLQDLYHKYEEQLLYVLFGGLTTLISIVTKLAVFALVPDQGQPWRTTLAVTLSWIFAVTFAFFTNKAYVFKNQTKGAKEFFRVFVRQRAGRAAANLANQLGGAVHSQQRALNIRTAFKALGRIRRYAEFFNGFINGRPLCRV